LGGEVAEKQDGFKSWVTTTGQQWPVLEDFTGNEVVARGFFGIEMVDGILKFSMNDESAFFVFKPCTFFIYNII
jgi:hypothetical protein